MISHTSAARSCYAHAIVIARCPRVLVARGNEVAITIVEESIEAALKDQGVTEGAQPTSIAHGERVFAEPSRTSPEQLATLQHEIELRDAFIAAAVHELRNPISPVYMQLENLKAVLESSDELPKVWLMNQLEAMTARFDRFLATLNRLLDASRIGEGLIALQLEHADLVDAVRAALASAQRELDGAGCTVELACPDELVGFWDRMRLEQIAGNLISNAARYGAGRPISISISIETSSDTAQLIVRDRGIGIAVEDQQRIFQRFERAHNVGRSPGFGVGLWIVAELCHAMDGSVSVESEPGTGASFTVSLPRRPRRRHR